MPRYRHTPYCTCALVMAAALLWANQSAATDSMPVMQQLREQRLQQEQLEHRRRLRTLQRSDDTPIEPEASPPTEQTQTACWPLSGVRLAGNRQLSSTDLVQALQPLIKPCMSPAQINQVLKAITQRYVDAGYLASRPYLDRQPHAGGTLDIVIVEGFVESIELASPGLPLSLRSAFPTLLGQPLRLDELEQGLDQLNRLKAFDLTADLLPGSVEGATRVLVTPRQLGARWHLNSSVDNRGNDATGRERLNLGLGLDSPLELNDFIQLSVNATLKPGANYSRGHGLYYSIPYGPWSYALGLNQLQYQSRLPGRRLFSSGRSDFFSLGLERNLWRNHQGLLSTSWRLEHKRLDNRLADYRLALQSPTLTSLEAGLNLLWLEDGVWSAYLGLSQGLHWLGADRVQRYRHAPQPQFRKYRANLLHLRQGQDPAWPWRWQSELNLQYSPDPLPAVEQQQVTDDTAVRGFRQQAVAGASAAVWRNSLSQPLPLGLPHGLVLRPVVGVDLGWAKYDHGSTPQRLAGAHAGLELSMPGNQLRFDYQRALHASGKRRQDLEPGFWLLEWVLNI
ncbi:ShlB/FhaC/HecB family hemolysin secretion/activation protein [Pseudomonas sp. GD03860]|mgnify:CR=1 FL=1|uniref:ShlB/FhaC/HecB family hemolysin secretion/activation protein n=1 Tax=Pseudomonas TaxID=286 RepID=UPI0023639E32|nr:MULTISPECIES: ShlB/FhaC/HecB family hemolysin secretion/activation protein [Pseudomonas]MDD2060426.1 ShlB/FhaC/HecB family hemolysin secretion/activation protein [Pseudomonas putida]MDH0635560.1 ShlB/FhaC/HecB family hemolysin secretion/activation protein [Pseudomonas sp. GD03860]